MASSESVMTWYERALGTSYAFSPLPPGLENKSVLATETSTGRRYVVRLSQRRSVQQVVCELDFISRAAESGASVLQVTDIFERASPVRETPDGVVAAFGFIDGYCDEHRCRSGFPVLAASIHRLMRAGLGMGDDHRRAARPFYDRTHQLLDRCGTGRCGRQELLKLHAAVDRLYESSSSQPRSIVHGDIHCTNAIWSRSGPVIIDFDDCYRGVPLDEITALTRGIAFSGKDLRQDMWNSIVGEFDEVAEEFGDREDRALERVAAECAYFFAAVVDSYDRNASCDVRVPTLDLQRSIAVILSTM